ncbi:macrolide-specific efflux system membrane fusion protein [Trinickia symbiotica]|uniref:Macrolide transporter subunit MacA n=1 Tax=Trinickia symbiotica TaxID=863227 RepID=A0A2N7WSC1_9BURK|nr:efflux RND transporter periplasmic adaptor subunit [Trinickia symbiotica]PMS32242.1 macrolide transporter subunit MacA [Trinickia symbiotica]PPK45198.1 macrolide-specific efflux system membrane fusion protein [Trinickia symbiotica]
MPKIHRRTLVAISGAAFLTAAAVLYHFYFAKDDPPNYLTAQVERADIEDAVLATGMLRALKEVDVGAQVSGQLKTLEVALGDKVTKGQTLAQIDPTLPQYALQQARVNEDDLRAERQAALARLREAELADEREQQLLLAEATSREAAATAAAALAVRRAELASLDAKLKKARIEVEKAMASVAYTRIVAPMDGEVVALVTQEGQTVIAEQQAPVILKLADLDTMTVKAQISEADVVRVAPGQPAYFTILGDPDTRYEGKLRAVEPAPHDFADVHSGGPGGKDKSSRPNTAVFYNALFEVPNPDHRLRISMTAQVSVVLGKASRALAIPASALGAKASDGSHSVRVLANDGRVETRNVRIGINNNVKAEVFAGLSEGERVIVGTAGKSSDAPLDAGA